jgi:hypothetical protein
MLELYVLSITLSNSSCVDTSVNPEVGTARIVTMLSGDKLTFCHHTRTLRNRQIFLLFFYVYNLGGVYKLPGKKKHPCCSFSLRSR